MFTLVLMLFVLVCLVLVITVLLQASKGGGLAGGAFGGTSDSSFLGGRGAATFLGKLTVYLASAFMALSLVLAILSSRTSAGPREQDSVVARRQQQGGVQVYNVDQGGSILNDLQMEGTPATAGSDSAK
jgi:preprotein translocase subunit SecG